MGPSRNQPHSPPFKGGVASRSILIKTAPHPAADKSNLSAIDRFHASIVPPALHHLHGPQSHPHLPPSRPNTRPSADTAQCSAQPDIRRNTCMASLPHRPLPS